jgi:acetyl esterase/lipase
VQQEGEALARWLRDRGITAFLLKYRVLQTTPEHRTRFFSERNPVPHIDSELPEIIPLAVADGRAALNYVRAHAREVGIVPTRVGMIGASAGATLVTSLATSQSDQPNPDFIALLYTHVPPQTRPLAVPRSAPPAFITVASDDQVTSAVPSTETYSAWIAAGRSAELHVYAKGGHGFGMLKQGLPVDSWTERFEDWLKSQGLLTRPAQEPGAKPRLMTPTDLATLPYNAPDLRVAYGRDSSQYGELRLPKRAGPHPVVVLIHGGCWKAAYGGSSQLGALADALAADGIATWNIEYRRLGQAGAGWPGTYLDVANAVDYLRTLARQYPLDLSRVVLVGPSAGGHLAMRAAARSRLPAQSPLYSADPLRVRWHSLIRRAQAHGRGGCLLRCGPRCEGCRPMQA